MAPEPRRRAAFVGTGHRAELWFTALLGDHAGAATPVALCDPSPTRIAYYQRLWERHHPGEPLGAYGPERFAEMLEEQRPDVVIVASVDRTHAGYVAAALDRGCDVICEKPLATDAEGCRTVVEAAERSSADLVVTFNYRYAPRNSMVKQLVAEGTIGTVTSVHFEWLLDTAHGADYFRRWHRQKSNSGGLLVHKATHHFDLVNWWLDDRPDTVSAHAALRFYGADNARARGLRNRPRRSRDALLSAPDRSDPFALDLAADERLRSLYLDAESDDGYVRDLDVFSEGVTIEDNMAVLAQYRGGALLSYALNAHAPWEGYRVALNGTAGRIELDVVERAVTTPQFLGTAQTPAGMSPAAAVDGGTRQRGTRLTVQRHWEPATVVPVTESDESPQHLGTAQTHGGGDALMLDDLFGPRTDDQLGRRAGYVDGVNSVLIGIAANRSTATGLPVRLGELGVPTPDRVSA